MENAADAETTYRDITASLKRFGILQRPYSAPAMVLGQSTPGHRRWSMPTQRCIAH